MFYEITIITVFKTVTKRLTIIKKQDINRVNTKMSRLALIIMYMLKKKVILEKKKRIMESAMDILKIMIKLMSK